MIHSVIHLEYKINPQNFKSSFLDRKSSDEAGCDYINLDFWTTLTFYQNFWREIVQAQPSFSSNAIINYISYNIYYDYSAFYNK